MHLPRLLCIDVSILTNRAELFGCCDVFLNQLDSAGKRLTGFRLDKLRLKPRPSKQRLFQHPFKPHNSSKTKSLPACTGLLLTTKDNSVDSSSTFVFDSL